MIDKNAWKVPEDSRPPEQFWKDFGNFVMATYVYDDSDEYWQTLIRWSDILQRRYGGHDMTGKIILDYVDSQSVKMKADPEFPEYKREEIA